MTVWFNEGQWYDDEKVVAKKVIPEKRVLSQTILDHALPNDSPDLIWQLRLDCGHTVSELVKNKGSPKGFYRLCNRCQKEEL